MGLELRLLGQQQREATKQAEVGVVVQKASKSMMGTSMVEKHSCHERHKPLSPSALWCLARASGRQVGRELEGIVGRVGLRGTERGREWIWWPTGKNQQR